MFSMMIKQHGKLQQWNSNTQQHNYYAYFSQYNFYTDVFSMKVHSDTDGNTETMKS